jgi:hypothetical protein
MLDPNTFASNREQGAAPAAGGSGGAAPDAPAPGQSAGGSGEDRRAMPSAPSPGGDGKTPSTPSTDAMIEAMRTADARLASAVLADWGEDTPRNLAFARGAAERLASPALVELLDGWEINGTPLGNHPAVVEAAARIGRLLAATPGDPRSLAAAPDQRSPASAAETARAKARIDELMRLMHEQPAKYRSDAVQKELQALFAGIHGERPIVGDRGRTI